MHVQEEVKTADIRTTTPLLMQVFKNQEVLCPVHFKVG
jgi:hypothetical protein